MAGPSHTSSESPPPTRRPVSRRACLSCREKKIKCDGEPISKIVAVDGSNKIIPQTTRVCSNCKFLGVECVFVQSNRGGRRKKRDSPEDEAISPSGSHDDDAAAKRTRRSESAGDVAATAAASDAASGDAPLPHHASPAFAPASDYYYPSSHLPKHPAGVPLGVPLGVPAASAPAQYPYDYSRHYGPFFHGATAPAPPYSRHWGVPSTGGFAAPPWARKHYWPYGTPGPHQLPHSSSAPALAPVPPHTPAAATTAPTTTAPTAAGSPAATAPPESTPRALPPTPNPVAPAYHYPDGEPQDDYASFDDPRWPHRKLSANKYHEFAPDHYREPYYHGALPRLSNSHVPSSELPRVPEPRSKPEFPLPPISVATNGSDPAAWPSPFAEAELSEYHLPEWPVLNEIIDIYYIYCQPRHQILPSKAVFLKRMSPSRESSVFHAIIANVCPIIGKESVKELPGLIKDEMLWVTSAYRHWDELNNMGILVATSLLAKTPTHRENLAQFGETTRRLYKLIDSNNYVRDNSAVSSTKMSRLNTSRQVFERELIIKSIWNFIVYHKILHRYQCGLQYVPRDCDNNTFDLENVVLPLDNSDYLEATKSVDRVTWKDVHATSSDYNSIIVSSKLLLELLQRASDSSFDYRVYADSVSKVSKQIKEQSILWFRPLKRIMINNSYLLSEFILNTGSVLNYSLPIKNIFVLKFQPSPDTSKMVMFPDIESHEADAMDSLTKTIEGIDQEHWVCFVNVLKHATALVDLVTLENGEITPDLIKEYNIIIGPTSLKQDPRTSWMMSEELESKIHDAWLKYPDFSLKACCELILLLNNLLILTKFIKIELDLKVVKVQTPTKDVQFSVHDSLLKALKEFDEEHLLRKRSLVKEFLEVKLQDLDGDSRSQTLVNIDKVNTHLSTMMKKS